jgi:hypothetical protein
MEYRKFMSWLAVAASLSLISPAFSQVIPTRTIDMTTVLNDEHGKPLKDAGGQDLKADPTCEKCPLLTLGHAIANVLFAPDKDASGQELWGRGELASRIKDDKTATLTADEIAKIKTLLAKDYPAPVIIMQAYPLLDPNAKPVDVK